MNAAQLNDPFKMFSYRCIKKSKDNFICLNSIDSEIGMIFLFCNLFFCLKLNYVPSFLPPLVVFVSFIVLWPLCGSKALVHDQDRG